MVFKVFEATREKPIKNDFVQTCTKYLDKLKINLSFEEIGNMSSYTFKNLVKTKTTEAGFAYLIMEKNKQTKISQIVYDKLQLQEYLCSENHNTDLSKFIFKGRTKTLDIKTHKNRNTMTKFVWAAI